MSKTVLFIIAVLGLCCATAFAGGKDHLYSTGRIMEVDRVASAWLIKRHIDPKARFAFFQDGDLITRGTAFDTPDARYTRTHNASTFEVLQRHFDIHGAAISALAAAVHDIEINYWAGKKDDPLSARLQGEIRAIIRANPEPEQCLEKCFVYLDTLVKQWSAGADPEKSIKE